MTTLGLSVGEKWPILSKMTMRIFESTPDRLDGTGQYELLPKPQVWPLFAPVDTKDIDRCYQIYSRWLDKELIFIRSYIEISQAGQAVHPGRYPYCRSPDGVSVHAK